MKTIFILGLFAFTLNVESNTLELMAKQDNTIYETQTQALSNGAGDYLFSGRTLQTEGLQYRRGLLSFDLADIPEGAVVQQVQLEITVSRFRSSGEVSVHVAESDWGEGTSDASAAEGAGAPATLGDATWVSAFNGDDKTSGISWNQVGGDYSASPSATTAFTENGTLSFSGQNITQDVQDWLSGTKPNYGWFVIGNESSSGTAVRFNSRENSNNPPKLIITYMMPHAVTIGTVKDNTLYETNDGSLSNGSGDELYFGKTGNNGGNALRRALIKFDLTGVPDGAIITDATLSVVLTAASNNAQNMNAQLRLALNDWGEGASSGGGSGAAAANGDATWLHTFFNTQTWNNPGGDFSNTVSSSASFDTSSSGIVIFPSNSEMVADLQLWLNNPNINHGWVLLGDEINNSNTRGISSKEGLFGPTLNLQYILPDLIFKDDFE